MQNLSRFFARPARTTAAAVAAVVVVLALLMLPPVRAVADQFLQIFRVQQVIFMPISADRIEQLESLDFDMQNLFIGEPEMLREPGEPQIVADFAEAASLVECPLQQPGVFPTEPISTEVVIQDSAAFQFQVDVEASRQLLDLLQIDDVSIPDTLGDEPVIVDVPQSVTSRHYGEDYTLGLHQGCSPNVTLPEGVDLAQLGKAGLRLLGMEAQQAETLSQQIDWSSTLIFPFPADMDSIRQVTVGDAQGLLVHSDSVHEYRRNTGEEEQAPGDDTAAYEPAWQLYWQDGDTFYVLQGTGDIGREDIIAVAESVN